MYKKWGTGFGTSSFSDALNFKNIGKREKRDQKIPQRNFIINEEWAGICYGLE